VAERSGGGAASFRASSLKAAALKAAASRNEEKLVSSLRDEKLFAISSRSEWPKLLVSS
jgi:hypothetical protein